MNDTVKSVKLIVVDFFSDAILMAFEFMFNYAKVRS